MVQTIIIAPFLLLSLLGMVYGTKEDRNYGHFDVLSKVSLEADPKALCNDGSPGAYYWKKSPTGSSRWIVMLLGTEGCYDKFSCERKREEHIGVWGGGMST